MNPTLTRALIVLTTIIMDLLAGMEFDLFVPSFPELQSFFGLTPFWVEATLSVNMVGYCISLFFVGSLADRYGHRSIILAGLVLFTIGSVLCVWAPSFSFLLVGRFIQGIGVAAPSIISFLIIADLYPVKQQQFLMGILNGVMNIAAGAAPVIGSYITLYFQWRGNFWTLLAMGLVTLTMTLIFIPKRQNTRPAEKLSYGGYFALLRSKTLMLMIVNFVILCVPYWIFVGMAPILYMEDLGVSLTHFGYYQGAFALIFGFGSITYGLIMHHFNQRKMLFLSIGLHVLSVILMALVIMMDSHNALLITISFLPFVLGQIVPSIVLYPLCLNLMPEAKGRISSLIQAGRLLITATGLQLAGYCYQGAFREIAMILGTFIVVGIVTQIMVLRNRVLV